MDDDATLYRLHDLALLLQAAGATFDWQGVCRRAVDWDLVLAVQQAGAALAARWPGLLPPAATGQLDDLQPSAGEREFMYALQSGQTDATANRLRAASRLPLLRRLCFLAEWLLPSPAYMRRRYDCGAAAAYVLRLKDALKRVRGR